MLPTSGKEEVSLAALLTSVKEPSTEPASSKVNHPEYQSGVGGALPWIPPPVEPFLPHGNVPPGGTMILTL